MISEMSFDLKKLTLSIVLKVDEIVGSYMTVALYSLLSPTLTLRAILLL